MRSGKLVVLAVAAVAAGIAVAAATGAIDPTVKNYAVGVAGGYETTRIISVGDTVDETSDPSKDYQMVGIPDGLGAHKNPTARSPCT